MVDALLDWPDLPLFAAIAAAAASLYMLGLIWFVQIVHYPLMAKVPRDAAIEYANAHTARTAWVTGPQMVAELGLSAAAWFLLRGESGPEGGLALAALAACLVNWVSTFFIQVPLHARLCKTGDRAAVSALVRTNWIRSAAWTAKSALSLAVVWMMITPS